MTQTAFQCDAFQNTAFQTNCGRKQTTGDKYHRVVFPAIRRKNEEQILMLFAAARTKKEVNSIECEVSYD